MRVKLLKIILMPIFFCMALNSCGGSSPKQDDKFTITWKNYDGTTLETDEVLYNTLPEYKGATPTKPDDTQHSYTFDSWTPKVVVATSNATYTATYKSTLAKALISFNLDGGHSEHSTESKYVTSIKKEDFFFNVTKSGVNFRGWTYNGTKVFDEKGNQLITPTLEERMTFVATYAENASMTIKKTVSKGGQIFSSDAPGSVTGEGYYHYNSEVDVSVTANVGYEFSGWYYQNNLLSDKPKHKYKMWSSDVELEARFNLLSFKLKVKAAQTDYGKVKINIDGHSTYKDEDEATIYYTDQVEIAAYTSIEEKRFSGWYDSDFKFVESNAVYSFVMPHNDYTLSAVWSSTDVYNVSISSSDSSLASVSGGGKCFYHTPMEVTTTPKVSEDAITFFGWYENDQLVSTNRTYKIDYVEKNYNLVAKWKGKEYTVTVTSEDTSKGTVDGEGKYAYNSSVTITATPKTGYSFEGWYKDGEKLPSAPASYSFNMPANDVSYEARFLDRRNAWYNKSDWWNYCSNGVLGEQASVSDIGKEVELTVNNQIHKVRLIGVDHDELNDGSGNKAHCTFEFANLLSDSDGYSLATLWNTDDGESSTNYDYLNSDLRKALDGQGNGTLRWYQKESETKSTTYTTSVINMLPSGLQSEIKTVKKEVATSTSYDPTNYDAKIFVLTFREMTQRPSPYAKEEGATYQYYKDNDDNPSRIKHQVMWHTGAVTSPTKITDSDITWSANNYAGHNSSTDRYGGYYWLASPNADDSSRAWGADVGGVLGSNVVYDGAFAVAPAFCI